MEIGLTEDVLRASRAEFEKDGSGPAAARAESASKTREKRMVMFDRGVGI